MIFSEPTMTHCPTEDILLDYTAGRLDPARAALFEKHAEGCAHCAALLTVQTAVWRNLDEWKPAPLSAGFNRELWRRIDADVQGPSWSRALAAVMQSHLWKQMAPLAVALAVVATAFVMDHSGSQPGRLRNTANAPIVVTASDADQLDRALDDIQLLDEADAAATPAKPGSGVM